MNYLQRKKLAFMSIVNQIKGFVRTVSGIPPLTLPDCVDNNSIINYTIGGNSVQNGTPTPENPVEVESVGVYDEEIGKYKIPIICSDGKGKSVTTNIYLDEPLRKVGSVADTIDFENQKVVRNVGVEEFDENTSASNYKYEPVGFYGFFRTIKTMKSGTRQYGFCTYLQNLRKESSPIWFGTGNQTVYFSLPDVYNLGSNNEERRQALRDWLASLEEPFMLYYPLAETTETPISLPKLPTIKGTTIYSIDTQIQPSNMEVSYYSTAKE